jgi:hypothetical protein
MSVEQHACRRAQRRAACDSEHVWIGQWVAKERLEHDARPGESSPDQPGEQNARKPYAKKDLGLRVRRERGVERLFEVERCRPDERAHDDGKSERGRHGADCQRPSPDRQSLH